MIIVQMTKNTTHRKKKRSKEKVGHWNRKIEIIISSGQLCS